MIRNILAALFSFILGSSALAQGCSVPNNLTNGTNADATQVMANLNAILACVNNQAAPRSYLAGLTLSTAGSSASFGIAAGVATSDDATTSMKLATSSTKTTGAWAVGSGNGSFDGTGPAPSATSGWYHVYLIERPDTGVVDVLTSNSATAPTLPTSYTKKRRIGSMKTNGSFQWIKFIQLGDDFLWDVPVQDVNTPNLSTTAVLTVLSVPPGVQVVAHVHGLVENPAAAQLFISSPDQTDTAPSNTVFTVYLNAGANMPFSARIRTDTLAQIRLRSSAATTFMWQNTFGWTDRRGRDA
jgi:hypothetical protein